MSIRKILFWLHLIIGCSAAIFIFLMSATGVALTYERQMIQAAEKADYPVVASQGRRLTLDEIMETNPLFSDIEKPSLSIESGSNSLFVVSKGRKTLAYLNPYTGQEVETPGKETKAFFKKLRGFHRWLTLDGSFSDTGRWINGIANVIFFILILSGLYLWLPNKITKRAFKSKLVLSRRHKSKQARNYQWHNVFGVYMTPILAVVVFTAFFFSFKLPGQLLKDNVETTASSLPVGESIKEGAEYQSYQNMIDSLVIAYPNWQRIQFAPANTSIQSFRLDYGSGGEPQKRLSIAIDKTTGKHTAVRSFEDNSTYMKIRSYIRFLHTGEVYGLLGQTLAGLASLLACLLVYTGLMLSIRRWQLSRSS